MLEILIIYFLGKRVAAIAEDKGYSGSLFVILFVGLWFIGEFFGIMLGIAASNVGGNFFVFYPLALMFAAGGAGLVFFIAIILPYKDDKDPSPLDFDRNGRPRRSARSRKRRPRRPRPVDDDYDDYDDRPARRRRPRQEADYDAVDEGYQAAPPPEKRRPRQPEPDYEVVEDDYEVVEDAQPADPEPEPPRPPRRRPSDGKY